MSGKLEEGDETRGIRTDLPDFKSSSPSDKDDGGSGFKHRSGAVPFDEKKPVVDNPNKILSVSSNSSSFTDSNNLLTADSTNKLSYVNRHRTLKSFRLRRRLKKYVSAAVISDDPLDERPYADVIIADIPIRGLLDSGASITVLGSGSEEFVEKSSVRFYHQPTLLSTASGELQRIIGQIKAFVSYNGKQRLMTIFIAPGLKQNLYLGIDF